MSHPGQACPRLSAYSLEKPLYLRQVLHSNHGHARVQLRSMGLRPAGDMRHIVKWVFSGTCRCEESASVLTHCSVAPSTESIRLPSMPAAAPMGRARQPRAEMCGRPATQVSNSQ